jgi:peptidylprolyl isomerase
VKATLLTVVLCVALALAGCGDGDDSSSGSTESSAPTESTPAAKKTKPKVTVPEAAPPKKLETEEIEEGTGSTAKAGDEVTVQYVGVGYDSEEEFDSSWSGNEPFTFGLGAERVIPGWEQGIEGMKVGGRRELTIPPNLAYGTAGSPPSIGPNETLIFVIDLLAVE